MKKNIWSCFKCTNCNEEGKCVSEVRYYYGDFSNYTVEDLSKDWRFKEVKKTKIIKKDKKKEKITYVYRKQLKLLKVLKKQWN